MPSAKFPTTPLGWLITVLSSMVGLLTSVWFLKLAEGMLG